MNCRNCGMPLTGPKCEYCGTDYSAELRPKKPCLILDENGITLYFETAQLSYAKVTASSAPEVLEE